MTRRSKEPESEPGLTFEDLMEAESLGFLEFDMDWGGKPLTIRWVPSRYTPALEALANAAQVTDEELDNDAPDVQVAVNRQDEAIRSVLAQVLESWSLTKDGKPLRTDLATLETLPRPFVRAVLGELSGEAIPKDPSSPASDEASSPTAS